MPLDSKCTNNNNIGFRDCYSYKLMKQTRESKLNNFYIKHNVNLNFYEWLERKGKKIFEKIGFLKVHISKGSGKLLDIDSISTNTLTNEFCKKQHTKQTHTTTTTKSKPNA